jgi:hypothetical protein
MQSPIRTMSVLATGLFVGSLSLQLPADDEAYTERFPVDDCWFSRYSSNSYFSLRPGRQSYLSNISCYQAGDCDALEEVTITVTDRREPIAFRADDERVRLRARVVNEFHQEDGEVSEISENWFAECLGTGDVYYFGEEVDIYEDGEIVSNDGAWRAGVDGAQPGIIMPGGAILIGSRYYQEVAPGIAQDRAVHVDKDFEVDVPAGHFDDCILIEETTPLDPEEMSTKIYCEDVGLVVDDDLELVDYYPKKRR